MNPKNQLHRVLEGLLEKIELQPTPGNFYNLGVCYSMLGDHEKEIDCYTKAIESGAHEDDVFLNLLIALIETDDQSKLVLLNHRFRTLFFKSCHLLLKLITAYAAHENSFMATLCAKKLMCLHQEEDAYTRLYLWIARLDGFMHGDKAPCARVPDLERAFIADESEPNLDLALCFNRYLDAYRPADQAVRNQETSTLLFEVLNNHFGGLINTVKPQQQNVTGRVVALTVGRYNCKRFLIDQLPKIKQGYECHLVVINNKHQLPLPTTIEVMTVEAHSVKELIRLWKDLNSLRAEKIFFDEIGMSPELQILSSLPWHAKTYTSWLHPVTTGSPFVDYFVTGKSMQGSRETFSEQLIFNGELGLKLNFAQIACKLPRDTEGSFLIGVVQNPLKIDEDFINFCASLLKRLKNSNIRFHLGTRLKTNRIFVRRLEKYFSKFRVSPDRYSFYSHSPRENFLDSLLDYELVLDTHFWSGGNTTLDSLEMGVPVFAKVGTTLRSKHTEAFLKILDIRECVSYKTEDLIDQIESIYSIYEKKKKFFKLFNERLALNYKKIPDSSEPILDFIARHRSFC